VESIQRSDEFASNLFAPSRYHEHDTEHQHPGVRTGCDSILMNSSTVASLVSGEGWNSPNARGNSPPL